MSSDSESKVVARSSAENIVQRKKVKRSSVWDIFKKNMIQRRNAHCHPEFQTKYANTTGLLRHLTHMHPDISISTTKIIESVYDTRKIVKPEDITEGIARMIALDLRSFDIVEGVGFNELFILVTTSFLNLNSFGNPDSFENPDKFENLEIFGYPS